MLSQKVHRAPPAVLAVPPGPSDAELLGRFVSGNDPEALAALVDRFGGLVWGVCRRVLTTAEDAEDAFQAVFIVLMKRGGTIQNQGGVGGWLYGVAYRTAMRARRDLARRRKAEGKAPPPAPSTGPTSEAACRELQRVLDEEVNRLPEKFKAPFVLCGIEGLSKAEAARELRWKEGTVSGRLAEARKRLQTRLVRRGITLAATLTLLELTRGTTAPAMPPMLFQATVAGLSGSLTGQAAVGLSATAVGLAEGVLHTMTALKLKLAATLVAITFALGGVAVATNQLGQPPRPEAKPQAAAPWRSVLFAGPPRPLFEVTDEQVLAVAFSPDGNRVVTAGGRHVLPGQIKFWEVATGRMLQKIQKIPGTRTVAFSPDGLVLACGEFGGAVALRDAITGQKQGTLKGHTRGVNSLAFSRDGTRLITAGLDRVVKLWDVNAQAEQKVFSGHTDAVFTVAFFARRNGLVSGGADMTARVWDADLGKESLVLKGHNGAVEQVAISPDDTVIATASWDGTIRLWDAKTGAETAVLMGHQPPVLAVAFSADGAWLASGGGAGEVRLWDAKARKLAATLGQHASGVWSVAFSPDGKLLASGSSDTTAKLWDVAAKKQQATLVTSELRPVDAVAYAPDGKNAAIAAGRATVELFNTATGTRRLTLSGHTDPVTCLAYTPDGLTLVSGSHDKSVRLWDAMSGATKGVLGKHHGPVRALAVSPGGKWLASAGDDAVVHLWDVATGSHRRACKGHTGPVHALAFSRDGAQLASGGADKFILLWDPEQPAEPNKLEGQAQPVRALLYADGALLSGGEDGTIEVWRPAARRNTVTPEAKSQLMIGHVGPVRVLAYLDGADGFVSGGCNGDIVQWALSGPRRAQLVGHRDRPVVALAIHPAGDELLSGGLDGQVLRWRKAVPFVTKGGGPRRFPEPPPPLPLLKEFYQDLRESRVPAPPLAIFGSRPELAVRPEERGLRVRVDANPEQTQRIGLDLPARFHGDFEITAAYELLQADRPKDGHGVGVSLIADMDSPAGEMLELMRTSRVNEGDTHGCCRKTVVAGKEKYELHWSPSTSRAGHLRLTRKGAEVIYSVREAGTSTFKVLQRLECGTEDVKQIRFAAYMGFAQNTVDVVLKDLRVGPPGSGPEVIAEPSEPPADPPVSPTHGRFHLILVGLSVMGLVVAGGFGLLFARRRQRVAVRAPGAATVVADPGPPIAFACSECGKKLRAPADSAGKSVPCPGCGGKVIVPNSEAIRE